MRGLIIGADNVTLDCNGRLIEGDGTFDAWDTGIHIDGKEGITVKNCRIENFSAGIGLRESHNNKIVKNFVNDNRHRGISINDSNHNLLDDNNVALSWHGSGISLGRSSFNTVSGNSISFSGTGIFLGNTSNENTLSGNFLARNHEGIYVKYSFRNTLIENTSNNNSVSGFTLWNGHKSFLSGNISSFNRYGVFMMATADCNLTENVFSGNDYYGAHLEYSCTRFNKFWKNSFLNNGKNSAQEIDGASLNDWNSGAVGNFWGDFELNPGYPEYYGIPGAGGGIDYHPIWPNFLRNGGFELDNGTDFFSEWSDDDPVAGNGVPDGWAREGAVELDAADSISGNSLRIWGNANHSRYAFQDIAVPFGETCVVSGWIKSDFTYSGGLTGKTSIKTSCLFPDHSRDSSSECGFNKNPGAFVSGQTGWTPFSFTVQANTEDRRLRVYCMNETLWGVSGNAWCDSLSVKPVSSGTDSGGHVPADETEKQVKEVVFI